MRLDSGQIEVVDPKVAEILRTKSPAERLQIAFSLWESARTFLLSHFATSHPEWSPQQVEAEVARRMSHGAA